jgi:hypothetical protein
MAKVYIFDEFGDRYEVTDIDAMLRELPEEGLEVLYKSTRYFHEFNKTVLELIDHKIIEQVEGEKYDVEGVENGMKAFEAEIKQRIGEATLTTWQEETDAQWEANRPDFSNPDQIEE